MSDVETVVTFLPAPRNCPRYTRISTREGLVPGLPLSAPKATPLTNATTLPQLVQRGNQLGAAETPRRAASSSPEDTVRVGIATSVLASWRWAASGSNLKATVHGDSTAHRPGSCLRVNPSVHLDRLSRPTASASSP
jgi:hypothetical protein